MKQFIPPKLNPEIHEATYLDGVMSIYNNDTDQIDFSFPFDLCPQELAEFHDIEITGGGGDWDHGTFFDNPQFIGNIRLEDFPWSSTQLIEFFIHLRKTYDQNKKVAASMRSLLAYRAYKRLKKIMGRSDPKVDK